LDCKTLQGIYMDDKLQRLTYEYFVLF
jgi:hypothetical protein